MLGKFVLFFIVCVSTCQLYSFTIVNQTDTEKTISIEEAYRPKSKDSREKLAPVSLGHSPIVLTVEPKSEAEFDLRENCAVLLVNVTSTQTSSNGYQTTNKTIKRQTCYEPYNYQGENFLQFTDDWGLLFYQPEDLPEVSTRNFNAYFARKTAVDQGYGIKCLHPIYLENVSPTGNLPDMLK